MLSVKGLHTHYGKIHALKGVDLEIRESEIVTLIGSNGAGKSTLLNTIIGIIPSSGGKVFFNEEEITNMPPHAIVKKRICMSPEGREVFPQLTVQENLRLGAYAIKDKKFIKGSFENVYSLFPRLKERTKQTAGTLSGGEQQMLAIGRALMSDPKLLLLDEPSLGLAPNLVLMIFKLIADINKQGVTILLIEQNANMALSIADRAYVLETGTIVLSGDAKELSKNDAVRKAYLGNT
ncbi:MAG: ABC transporter ATP-binding protein [Eubacteriales bacterium]|nr:ABC transporter ATP-binding protein [Eubacteriales bacterium]